jgi:hypothetical protein
MTTPAGQIFIIVNTSTYRPRFYESCVNCGGIWECYLKIQIESGGYWAVPSIFLTLIWIFPLNSSGFPISSCECKGSSLLFIQQVCSGVPRRINYVFDAGDHDSGF